jgi:hypothetical protein
VNAAVISLAVVFGVMIAASVGLFWLDQPIAGWTSLVVAIIGSLSILGMVVSSAAARRT